MPLKPPPHNHGLSVDFTVPFQNSGLFQQMLLATADPAIPLRNHQVRVLENIYFNQIRVQLIAEVTDPKSFGPVTTRFGAQQTVSLYANPNITERELCAILADLNKKLQEEYMARFCGAFRYAGALYLGAEPQKLEEHVSKSLFEFIVDPPIPIDAAMMGISAQGQSYTEVTDFLTGATQGVLWDWVGADYTPSDFVEEFIRQGFSMRVGADPNNPKRLLQLLEEFKKAKVINFISPRAIICDLALPEFWNDRMPRFNPSCLKDIAEHNDPNFRGMCASLWWEDIPNSHLNKSAGGRRAVTRTGGDTSYLAALAPKGLNGNNYHHPGVFLTVPLEAFRFEVIADPLEHKDEQLIQQLLSADFDVPFALCQQ